MASICVSSRLVLSCLVLLLGCQANVEPASHEVCQQLEDFKSQINTLRASNLDAALRHRDKLEEILSLETEKIFLQSNLKAEDVLNFLDITYKELHHLLKEHLNTTFPNLINEYRVKTAKELLANPAQSNLSMDEVAILSGFGTRQTFYKVFQASVGVSPGMFKAHIQQDD